MCNEYNNIGFRSDGVCVCVASNCAANINAVVHCEMVRVRVRAANTLFRGLIRVNCIKTPTTFIGI